MKISFHLKILRLQILIQVFLSICNNGFSFQTSLNGIINKYARVTTIGTNNVIISDATQFSYFSAGDTVLLIQMKGAECLVSEDATYGMYQISVGTTGIYEFLIIQSVESGSCKVTFRNNIRNNYSVPGDVQLVRVPSFNAVKVEAELNCPAWDSATKTGGVLSLFAGTKLTLNANINVKGKGFMGGAAVIGLGNCIESGGGLNNFSYPYSWQNSGLKGESQVSRAYVNSYVQNPIFPEYSKGHGANFTGGGGGNGRFSGGGGGSLIGTGGKGGLESNTCLVREYGGIGGSSITSVLSSAGLYLGGGGGGSTYLSGATPSAGGIGGGIIIIVCETIDGNGYSILADGESSGTASGNAGSGGGGGGGTVALYLQNFSSNTLALSAKGGSGGNNAGSFGEGGGGGGGRITTSNITIPGNVTRVLSGGVYGIRAGVGHDATSGTAGDILSTFVPVLNGFLFNSIVSSVTLNLVDSIDNNTVPPKITGTKPIGGIPPYSYLWEKSYDRVNWTTLVNDSDPVNYTPSTIEISTVYFRRTITDASSLPMIDVSKPVKIYIKLATYIKQDLSDNSFNIYPNPLNSTTDISFTLQSKSFVSLAVFDDAGRQLSMLVSKNLIAGAYTYQWNASGLPAGVYICHFQAGRSVETKKIIIKR
jgi:hypothetical protein